ncbi:EAL domain-containing protein [Halomonas halophila]|uniref:EAL domain-containing protein n=1 Tax=Halomonas halophila TaxID=29573 RepID=UPI000D16F69A|nr:EAL domain-containing protein [Halomonas sp. SL1]
MTCLRHWAYGGILLLALGVAVPSWAAVTTVAIAPGEPGGRLDRQLLSELDDRLEARDGPGALRVLYLEDGEVSTAELRRKLAEGDLADAPRVILLHDAAIATYRELGASGASPSRRLAAYGAFSPANRRWLRQQGAGHLDLLPVLRRHLSWVRHGTEARRLVGWVTQDAPLLSLGDRLIEGSARLDAVKVLGRDAPVAGEATEQLLLGLPGRLQRQQAAEVLGSRRGAWCLMPEWLADGCFGGVQPDIAGVADGLLRRLDQGGNATAPAAPRLDYAARGRLSPELRDGVRYLNVPATEVGRRSLGERLLLGALLVGAGALVALGGALGAERHRRRQRERFGFDELTGLPGRPRLEKRMQRYLNSQHPFQLCWIGFDRLDGLQDTLGPEGTREAVRRIVKRLRRVARGEGYVVRLEGDVFAVMSFLPVRERGESPAGMMFAERLQESLSAPFHVGNADRLLLPRIGIARSSADSTPFSLLEEAQGAARQVLRGGERRPRELVAEAAAPEERSLALTEALASLSGEALSEQLTLAVEPRFLLADRRCCGGEFRARWRHATWGEVPGKELMRLAEAAGRRALLDRTLCGMALDALAHSGLPVEAPQGPRSARPVWTLPLGLAQLTDAGFIDGLSERCEALGLTPDCVELQWHGAELGESWPLQSAIRYCRERGFGVALKGLVHSRQALDAIFRQPLSRLVLEPRLMRGVPSDQASILLTKSLRDMAKLAGRHITVTGVATSDQLVAIRGMNFVSVQGPLFGEVQSIEALVDRLAAGEAAETARDEDPGAGDEASRSAEANRGQE